MRASGLEEDRLDPHLVLGAADEDLQAPARHGPEGPARVKERDQMRDAQLGTVVVLEMDLEEHTSSSQLGG